MAGGLAELATISTIATGISYQNNQLQAARDVNKLEYEQRVQQLGTELTNIQLQRQQAQLQVNQQLQQNEKSYTQGMYEVLKQRVAAQEQAYAGREQGMQIEAGTSNEVQQQYKQALDAAFQLQAMQQQEAGKNAQIDMMVDPLTSTNAANRMSNLQNQVQAFVQNRIMNNDVIGDARVQGDYATALSEIMRRIGINDSQLTTNMADQNSANISSQRLANQTQINQQNALNSQAFSQAEQGIRNAQDMEYQRYMSDDKNLMRLDSAKQQAASQQSMSLSGYTYKDGAWYDTKSSFKPVVMAGGSGTYNTPAPTYNTQQQPYGYSSNQNSGSSYLGNGDMQYQSLRSNPNNIIDLETPPMRQQIIVTRPANQSKPPEAPKGKK